MPGDMGLWLLYAGLLLIPCAVQTLSCFLVRRKLLKCIPIYIVAVCFILSLMMFLGVLGDFPFGDVDLHGLVGLMFMSLVGIAAAGVALAWGIYGITLLVRRKSASQNHKPSV